jgi:Fumarylacetoacetate (FAA) hydrolase family
MKLVLFQKSGADDVWPGVLTERGVISIADAVPSSHTPQLTMQGIIDHFDAFAPIGPCNATLDEIPDPNNVHVQFWVDGQLRHNYNTDDMEHLVPELVEFATAIMTLNSGDLIACGTNHEGLGPLQDTEVVDFEIHGIGRMRLHVHDPLKRSWEKGIYMGADSTNPEAVKRNRPKAGG